MTEWIRIEEFPDYLINRSGEIMNEWTNRILNHRLNKEGFPMVNLMGPDKQYTRGVARLLAKAHMEPHPLPAFDSLIHLDGDRGNITLDNLMWRPRWFVMQYHKQFDNPRRIEVPVYLVDTDEVFDNIMEACVKYGLLEKRVYLAMLNRELVWPLSYEFREYRE